MSLGEAAFDAQFGSVTSSEAPLDFGLFPTDGLMVTNGVIGPVQ
jgi:hypothetical protein